MLAHPADALAILTGVRERSRRHLSIALPDLDALTIALAAGSADSVALLEYMQDGPARAEAVAAAAQLALTDEEFVILFGQSMEARARATSTAACQRVVVHEGRPEARAARRQMEAALLTTLQEGVQGAAWKSSPVTRIAAQVALCRSTDATACLSAVVGGMVPTDSRRVDDLKTATEDAGLDVMVVSEALRALASVIVQ